MTARDEAVEAMANSFDGAGEDDQVFAAIEGTLEGAGYLPLFEHLIDAIPADVLARYAIERGGLDDDGTWVLPNDPDDYFVHYEDELRPDNAVSLYRLAEEGTD